MSDGTNIPRRELPEHLIDAYVCGDFEGEELARVEAVLARSLELATQVAARQRDREGFASLHPFAPIRAKLLDRQPKRASGLQTRWAPVFAGAAAAVLIGVLIVLPESGSEISVRGGLKATAIVNRNGDVFEHDGQARLHANDRLRIRVEDPIGGHLMVLGLSQSGTIDVYYEPLEIAPGTTTLPRGLILDDSPEDEALVIVMSNEPLGTGDMRAWLDAQESRGAFPPRLQAPAGVRLAVIPLPKASR